MTHPHMTFGQMLETPHQENYTNSQQKMSLMGQFQKNKGP